MTKKQKDLHQEMKNINPLTKLNQLSTGILQEQAAAYLASGSYKMTQEIYKLLLKREENPVFRQGLADCYLKRALHAAGQEKYKEAVTFWENYHQNSNAHRSNHDYITWLIEVGNISKIKNYLHDLGYQQLESEFPQLVFQLAYYHVIGQLDLSAMMPETSVLAQQTKVIDGSLAALKNNDFDALNQYLKQIPFRSPYRDFVTFLKAAVLITDAPGRVQTLLKKIPADSPYVEMAGLLEGFYLSNKDLLDFLKPLPVKQQTVIANSRQYTNKQIKLLQYLSRQKKSLSNKAKFELAIQYQELLGAQYTQRFCQALLPDYPAGKKLYEKNFGLMDSFETARIQALTQENKGELYDAMDHWEDAVAVLQGDERNHLKIAMIYQHISVFLSDDQRLPYLKLALEYNPLDRAVNEQLLRSFEKLGMKAEYKAQFKTMLENFPKDVKVLELAMQQALDNKTYKKASTYANKILKLDTVNSKAKQVVFDSHYKHAVKLIKSGKLHLVDKEISFAEQMNLGKDYASQAALLRGFFEYYNVSRTQGIEAINHAVVSATDRQIINRYRVIKYANDFIFSKAEIKRLYPKLPATYRLSGDEINDFLTLLESDYAESLYRVAENMELIKADFKRSLKQCSLSDDRLVSIIQQFEMINDYEMMRHCVSCAQNGKAPVWEFYRLYIKNRASLFNFDVLDLQKVRKLLTQAEKKGDATCTMLITNLFEQNNRLHDLDGMQEPVIEAFDPYLHLFNGIDQRSINKINKRFDEITQNNSEDKIVKKIIELVGDRSAVDIVFQDPDCLDAVLFLIAAKEINLDNGINFQDILEIAQAQSGGNMSGFSF